MNTARLHFQKQDLNNKILVKKNITSAISIDDFKDEEACMDYISQKRWSGRPMCLSCGAENCYLTKSGYRCRVKSCLKKFNALKGTIFEGSQIKILDWFKALNMIANSYDGITASELSYALGFSHVSAWSLISRIEAILVTYKSSRISVDSDLDYTNHQRDTLVIERKKGRPGKSLRVNYSFEELVNMSIFTKKLVKKNVPAKLTDFLSN